MSASKKKPSASAKLSTIQPSGKRDDNFFAQVYDVVRQIPKGRVTSYGAIAASLGAKTSSRLVGYAMNGAGIIKPKVPAHRVVNRNGDLTGMHHFSPQERMQQLLEKEGVKVENNRVVDFKKKFWDPREHADDAD